MVTGVNGRRKPDRGGVPSNETILKEYNINMGYDIVFCGCFFLWLAFGNLNNGSGNAGLSYLNGNNDLGNARWNIFARFLVNVL